MRKFLLAALAAAVLLQGCDIMPLRGVPLFSSYDEAWDWINENIEYRRDEGESWSPPNDTVSRGYGDCEDKGLLMLDIVAQQFGEEGILVCGGNGDTFHAWVEFKCGRYGFIEGYKPLVRYSYRTAMAMAHVI